MAAPKSTARSKLKAIRIRMVETGESYDTAANHLDEAKGIELPPTDIKDWRFDYPTYNAFNTE